MPDTPSPVHAPRWFDPRAREAGSRAFIFNRISALGLTFYLGLHLVVLNKLAQGAKAYDDFVTFSQSPLIKSAEVILIAAVVFHGLNGLRLTLHAFAVAVCYQKILLAVVTVITVVITTLFAIRLFGA
jgi:succinate dehydrogenase / fumarate reductase cytochrome b subunit